LEQDHYAYEEYTVLDTVIMGNPRLYEVMKQKDALYEKADFSEEDGILVSELEGEFTKLNGWEAESDASKLLQGLNLSLDILDSQMKTLGGSEKVKVLLAQALFGEPDVVLLDEPTNHVDVESVNWMEEFLIEYPGTVIVVSHDRHFLNNVCTHIIDIDYTRVNLYTGNYEFWYESSRMMQQMNRDQAKKSEEKIKELQKFIARFSANKSKSKQATSRKKLIEKLTVEELPASSRRYPFVGFTMDRQLGKDILTVDGISKTIDGEKVLDNVSFVVGREDKIAFVGEHELANSTLFKILMEEIEPDEGTFKWGVSTSQSYFPLDNTKFFHDSEYDIINWLKQYSSDTTDTY
jgi:ATPase subunit of ABC transporter with duplicated ATPase domains